MVPSLYKEDQVPFLGLWKVEKAQLFDLTYNSSSHSKDSKPDGINGWATL